MSQTPKRPALTDTPTSSTRPAKKGKTLGRVVSQARSSQSRAVVRAVTVRVRRTNDSASVKRMKNVARDSTISATPSNHEIDTPSSCPPEDAAVHPPFDVDMESVVVDVPQAPRKKSKKYTTTVSPVQAQ